MPALSFSQGNGMFLPFPVPRTPGVPSLGNLSPRRPCKQRHENGKLGFHAPSPLPCQVWAPLPPCAGGEWVAFPPCSAAPDPSPPRCSGNNSHLSQWANGAPSGPPGPAWATRCPCQPRALGREGTVARVCLFLAPGRLPTCCWPQNGLIKRSDLLSACICGRRRDKRAVFASLQLHSGDVSPVYCSGKKFPYKQIISFTSPPRKYFPVSSKRRIYMKQGAIQNLRRKRAAKYLLYS